jgi:folate-binding protein YgfZ
MSDFAQLVGSGAAVRRLAGRGLLRVTGRDRVRFLQGMLTNDVSALQTGDVCYAAQLDRKGHLLSDLWVLAREQELLLDTAPGRAAAVAEILTKHVIADDVELEDLSEEWAVVAFEGPDARSAAGAPALEPNTLAADGPLLWVAAGTLTPEGVRLLGPSDAVAAAVERTSLPELSEVRAEILRVEAFLPSFDVDMSERTFPAEARLEGALSFTKGCYIGQEIVARIASRGAVNRLLVQLEADAPVEVGAPIAVEGRAVGEVTSAAVSPVRGALALGYVKRAHAQPDTVVAIGDVVARVVGPPLEVEP